MSVFKCKMCGGTLEIQPGATVAECEYCGTRQTLPKLDEERKANLFDRANHFRRNNEFDKAMSIYEQILNEDQTDAETYWSIVLCRYGIEYVEDPHTHKRVPTVNRAQFTSIFADEDYKAALQYADSYQQELYKEEAKTIDEIQKDILAISQKEEPFDVFICYKETDHNGRRTPDSVLANDLYHQLVQEGMKVFFSRITLEDKLGSAYEPYIFAALNSAKVMVVLGTKAEFFNAVWVKNEWSRYLSLIKKDSSKVLIPAYKDMDPYDLPEEFSHLQAQDMSKIGFLQDLIRGIKKIVNTNKPTESLREHLIENNYNASITPLLKRVFMFLEDKDWESADEYCERVLDMDPENAQAYLGKMMAELKASKQESLRNCKKPFDNNRYYKKICRFADDNLIHTLEGYINNIKELNEIVRKERIYQDALKELPRAKTEHEFETVASLFESIQDYKDAEALLQQCKKDAEEAHKEATYKQACLDANNILYLQRAINNFNSILEWKDSAERLKECQEKLERLKEEQQQGKLKAEKRQKIVKKCKRIFIVIIILILVDVIFGPYFKYMIDSTKKYNKAMEAIEEKDYITAHKLLFEIGDFKDSKKQLDKIETNRMHAVLSQAEIGDIITFGTREISLDSKNVEEIEWLVLDKKDNRALVISRYYIINMEYLEDVVDGSIIWEDCFIRKWLNKTFLNNAFTEVQREMIPTVTIDNNKDNKTKDKIFLLSEEEANYYFGFDLEDFSYAQPYHEWWLRSVNEEGYATYVSEYNEIKNADLEESESIKGVRPALWINLE